MTDLSNVLSVGTEHFLDTVGLFVKLGQTTLVFKHVLGRFLHGAEVLCETLAQPQLELQATQESVITRKNTKQS